MAQSPDIPRSTNLIQTIKNLRAPHAHTDTGWIRVGTYIGYGNVGNDPGTDELSPPFQNSWANRGSAGDPPTSFHLSDSGEVRIKGVITGGAAGTVVFTLPEGYRPEEVMTFLGALKSGNGMAIITVSPNGNVTLVSTWSSP